MRAIEALSNDREDLKFDETILQIDNPKDIDNERVQMHKKFIEVAALLLATCVVKGVWWMEPGEARLRSPGRTPLREASDVAMEQVTAVGHNARSISVEVDPMNLM